MEKTLYKTEISTTTGVKTLEVMCADMTKLSFQTDVLVCSAFVGDYVPVERTLIGALYKNQGITVESMAQDPLIDMRQIGVWLSRPTQNEQIRAIACVEMTDWYRSPASDGFLDSFQKKADDFLHRMKTEQINEESFKSLAHKFQEFIHSWCHSSWNSEKLISACEQLDSLTRETGIPMMQDVIALAETICADFLVAHEARRCSHEDSRIGSLDWHDSGTKDAFFLCYSSLFTMLRLAALTGVSVHTVVLPLLGAGKQMLDEENSAMALITECQNALKTIDSIERIVIADISQQKAEAIARMVQELYPKVIQKEVFISYNNQDSCYAEYLADQLTQRGIKVWIDSQKLKAAEFGGIIVKAIKGADLFAVLISQNSMNSKHVLTEVANAFNTDSDTPEILPVLLDRTPYSDDFSYYLIGKHFEIAQTEPKEKELQQIAENILQFFEEKTHSDGVQPTPSP